MSVRYGFLRALLACCLLVAGGDPASADADGLACDATTGRDGVELQSGDTSSVKCVSAGAFASGSTPCCSGLVKDADSRCQSATCKKDGEQGVLASNGTNNCCFGLVLINGVCKVPTLQATCTLSGAAPTTAKPCCKGLLKSSQTGQCTPSVQQCSGDKLSSCCYGSSVNTCSTCYCPAPYYGL